MDSRRTSQSKIYGQYDGGPVIGATVKMKGATTGSVTDLDGKYTISVKPGSTLEVSYLGYQTQEVKSETEPPSTWC